MIHPMASPLAARADRERQIVAATRALFDEQGVQEAAIDGIARAVGINKALIYRHVASKEELFILALIDYLGELRDGFPRGMADPAAALREALDRYAAFCLEYPAFLDCALSLMRRPAGELRARVSEGTWLRLGRAMTDCLGPLAALMRAAGVEDADYIANRVYAQVLGTMHLARVGVGVTEAGPGVPGVFAIDPERVRRDCVADALALALDD
jgi:AcrR family transcriptional regulator